MGTLVSFTALFLSILLVQLGSGSLGPLDALAGRLHGFSAEEIGLLGSAHFVGFLAGCYFAPRQIGAIGHSRAFAAAAAIGATGALLHPVIVGPWAWAALRLLTGFAIAAAYTVVESWLQGKATNRNRARIYSVFRLVDLGGQMTAQAMIAVLDPAAYWAYNIVAVFCVLCLLPLALTRSLPPVVPRAPRLRPLAALRLSPTATLGIVVAGMAGAAFRMVGPVYAFENGLGQGEIALFLSAAIAGGFAAQLPVGIVADRVDRRAVLVGLSVAAVLGSLWTIYAVAPGSTLLILLAAFFFGASTYPVYSVAAAYANDLAEPEFIVELNAALMLFYSIGAIISPVLSATLVTAFGPQALFGFTAAAHLALILFAAWRMTRRAAPAPRMPYQMIPRSSMIIARLFRRPPAEAAPGLAPGRERAAAD